MALHKIIHFKSNVRFKRWTKALNEMITASDIIMNRYEWIPELIITSVNDSVHNKNSRHYKDEAIDIRSKNFKNLQDKLMFKSALADELGPKFTVLLEGLDTPNEHFHVQVKKGETFP